MLWTETHSPKSFKEITIHSDIANVLCKLAENDNVPHLLFYGPPGSGKNTLIRSFLTELYGEGALKLKVENHEIKVNPSKTIQFYTLNSIFHIQINPSLSGNDDKLVITEILKNTASTLSLSNAPKNHFKIIIIEDAENLSMNAQHSLRRTMEKYTKTCRLILCSENINKLIDPLISRCFCIRVSSPSEESISSVLRNIAKKEKIELTKDFENKLISQNNRNLGKTILSFQSSYLENYPFKKTQMVVKPGWEIFLKELSLLICEEASAKRLLIVRSKLYELLNRLIPPSLILKTLNFHLLEKCDFSLQKKIITAAAQHEERMIRGSKPILHLEAFVAAFMQFYQNWSSELFE